MWDNTNVKQKKLKQEIPETQDLNHRSPNIYIQSFPQRKNGQKSGYATEPCTHTPICMKCKTLYMKLWEQGHCGIAVLHALPTISWGPNDQGKDFTQLQR